MSMIQNHHGITDQIRLILAACIRFITKHLWRHHYDMSGVCKNDRSILTDATSHEWFKPCRKLKDSQNMAPPLHVGQGEL